MSSDVATYLAVPWDERSLPWLRNMLRLAIKLELATIPPYLCAFWSIPEDPPGYIKRRLQRILAEEMRHLAMACNLLGAIHPGAADADDPDLPVFNHNGTVPVYPGPLPGGVHPGLIVTLKKLTKDQIGTQFMQIEFPHPDAATQHGQESFPTIGGFYRAISEYIAHNSIPIATSYQVECGRLFVGLIRNVQDALDAVFAIAAEGEGAHGSPFITGPGGNEVLSHYYQFAEFFWQRKIVECNGGWGFCGDEVDWPASILDMAAVPRGGYWTTDALRFDRQYTAILELLTQAWHAGDPVAGEQFLNQAIVRMISDDPGSLQDLAIKLMSTPRPDGHGNYGPCFRLFTH
jgi:hypothetical protein